MTIGEWIRSSGDEELAAMLVNWMVTIVVSIGLDYKKINLIKEFDELVKYLDSPISEEVKESFNVFIAHSERMN